MMSGDDNGDKVVRLPGVDEERARRLKVEVERLAHQSTTEWIYYVETPGYAEKYGVDKATLKRMVEAVIKENEKKEREKRQIEARGEKEKERKADKKERLDRQVKKDETKKAEKKERERQKALATIVKLPRSEHEATLQELSRRLDEDLDGLREELALRRVSRGPSRLTARSCWTRRRRNSDATLSSTTKLLAPSTR